MENNQSYNSNQSRRNFLKIIGVAGAGISLLGLEGCFNNDKSIRLASSGTLDLGKFWAQLEKDLGTKLIFQDNGNDTGPIIANMINGSYAYDYDVSGLQGGCERELALAKKILPWDLDKIPNWQKTWAWVKDIPQFKIDGKQYGLPTIANADSVIYLKDKIGGIVDSYEVIFDTKFKGRTAMEDTWINSVIFTAIYLKENSIVPIGDPGDLTESELGTVMEFLIKKKKEGQFKTFWKGWESGLSLIKSQEVYAMTGWEPIQKEAKKMGLDCEYAIPREGYEGWTNNVVLHIGAEKRGLVGLAHEFANWELNGYYGCVMAKEKGYIVPNDLSVEYAKKDKNFNEAEIEEKIEHVKNKFSKNKVYWQNTRPKNYKLYEEWWSKLRTA